MRRHHQSHGKVVALSRRYASRTLALSLSVSSASLTPVRLAARRHVLSSANERRCAQCHLCIQSAAARPPGHATYTVYLPSYPRTRIHHLRRSRCAPGRRTCVVLAARLASGHRRPHCRPARSVAPAHRPDRLAPHRPSCTTQSVLHHADRIDASGIYRTTPPHLSALKGEAATDSSQCQLETLAAAPLTNSVLSGASGRGGDSTGGARPVLGPYCRTLTKAVP